MNAILTPRAADVLAASDESLSPIFGRGEPGVFESMGMTPVSVDSLSIRSPHPLSPTCTGVGGERTALELELLAALRKIAATDPDEDGCYYKNRESISIARKALAAAGAAK
jgi:hypothetical protein